MKKLILCLILCLFSFNVYAHECFNKETISYLTKEYIYMTYGYKSENAFKIAHPEMSRQLYNVIEQDKQRTTMILWRSGRSQPIIAEMIKNTTIEPINLRTNPFIKDEQVHIPVEGQIKVNMPLLPSDIADIKGTLVVDEIDGSCKIFDVYAH